MAKSDATAAERHRLIVARALQEWRATERSKREPSGSAIAHRIVSDLMRDIEKGAFAVKSRRPNA